MTLGLRSVMTGFGIRNSIHPIFPLYGFSCFVHVSLEAEKSPRWQEPTNNYPVLGRREEKSASNQMPSAGVVRSEIGVMPSNKPADRKIYAARFVVGKGSSWINKSVISSR